MSASENHCLPNQIIIKNNCPSAATTRTHSTHTPPRELTPQSLRNAFDGAKADGRVGKQADSRGAAHGAVQHVKHWRVCLPEEFDHLLHRHQLRPTGRGEHEHGTRSDKAFHEVSYWYALSVSPWPSENSVGARSS